MKHQRSSGELNLSDNDEKELQRHVPCSSLFDSIRLRRSIMKTREIVLGTAAVLCIGALSSAQIAPQGQAAPQARTQQPRAERTKGAETHLAGCLYLEHSIQGSSPNVAERAGVLEDYILTDAAPAREPKRLSDPPIADA